MIAYKICLNGKALYTVGQNDQAVLSAHVTSTGQASENEGHIRFSAHGLSEENTEGFSEHFRWQEIDLSLGDRVEIQVLESMDVDEPIKRYRSDKEVQESPFTEEEYKEMRYETYLDLKKEFEGDNNA